MRTNTEVGNHFQICRPFYSHKKAAFLFTMTTDKLIKKILSELDITEPTLEQYQKIEKVIENESDWYFVACVIFYFIGCGVVFLLTNVFK